MARVPRRAQKTRQFARKGDAERFLDAVRGVPGTGWISSAFIGWSGPLGVAAIYCLVYIERYHLPDYERLFLAGR